MRSSPLDECFDKIQRMAKPIKSKPPTTTLAVAAPPKLLNDLRTLISQSRQQVAQAINSVLVMLYWQVGHRIRTDVLREKRADYGKEIVHALSGQLTGEFGNGFGRANLFHMVRFAEVFPDEQIVYALSRQLGWTHLRQIIYLKEPLQREFYAEMCRIERWSTRTLADKIQGMLYERTAISRKPAQLAKQAPAQTKKSLNSLTALRESRIFCSGGQSFFCLSLADPASPSLRGCERVPAGIRPHPR